MNLVNGHPVVGKFLLLFRIPCPRNQIRKESFALFVCTRLFDALDEDVAADVVNVETEADNVADVAPDLHQDGAAAAADGGAVEVLVLRHVVLHREHCLAVLLRTC